MFLKVLDRRDREMGSGIGSDVDEHINLVPHCHVNRACFARVHVGMVTFGKVKAVWESERP